MDRLSSIKKALEQTKPLTGTLQEDVQWLIEQAKKAEELRKQNWELNKEIGGYAGTIEALAEEMQMLTGRMNILKAKMFNP